MQNAVSLALTRLKNGTGTGPAPGTQPLLFATVQNRVYENPVSSGTTNRYFFYWKHILGADMTTLALGAMNWRQAANTGQVNNLNDITYEGISIIANGVAVQVTWSGISTKTLVAGDNEVISDEIPVASFGGTLDRNDEIWIKGIVSFADGGSVPYGAQSTGDVATSQSGFFSSGATTASAINAIGPFNFTGVAPSNTGVVHCPLVLGRAKYTTKAYIGVGDSIMWGYGDSVSQGAYGRGFYQRALQSGAFTEPKCAACFATSGSPIDDFLGSNTKWRAWIKYANRGVDEILTNGLGGASLEIAQGKEQDLWTIFRDNGCRKIIRTELICRTSASTDDYSTLEGQTLDPNWTAGNRAWQLNDWFPTQIGTYIDSVVDMSTLRQADIYWKTNGTPALMTTDGTHLYDNGGNAIGNYTAAIQLRAAIASTH